MTRRGFLFASIAAAVAPALPAPAEREYIALISEANLAPGHMLGYTVWIPRQMWYENPEWASAIIRAAIDGSVRVLGGRCVSCMELVDELGRGYWYRPVIEA